MSNRLISILGISWATLAVAYVSLLGTTVFYAARQAELADSLHSAEAGIGSLEQTYLARVKEITLDPVASAGFVRPGQVEYATAPSSGLSRAGN